MKRKRHACVQRVGCAPEECMPDSSPLSDKAVVLCIAEIRDLAAGTASDHRGDEHPVLLQKLPDIPSLLPQGGGGRPSGADHGGVDGGHEPSRSPTLRAIASGKLAVTANMAVIARHGQEITAAVAARGMYVLIEAALAGGIPIINGTTNYILSCMAEQDAAYVTAPKITILAFGGAVLRPGIAHGGHRAARRRGVISECAAQLGFVVKRLAVGEHIEPEEEAAQKLDVRLPLTLLPKENPLAGAHGATTPFSWRGIR